MAWKEEGLQKATATVQGKVQGCIDLGPRRAGSGRAEAADPAATWLYMAAHV